jgi:SNF2 family DNA or RNA helicase
MELENSPEPVTAKMILDKIGKLQQIMGGKWIENDKNNKILVLEDLLEQAIGAGKQVVIWCRYTHSRERVAELLEKMNIRYSLVHGGVPSIQIPKDKRVEDYTHDELASRGGQIKLFQAGVNKVFVGSLQACSEGITLTAGTVAIYYENTFSLKDRLQSEKRCHRIGQKFNVTYVDLIYKRSWDEIMMNGIDGKQDMGSYLAGSFRKGDYKLIEEGKNVDTTA